MAKDFTITVAPANGSTVEIKGEVSWEAFSKFEQQAFDRLAEHLDLDGFRKGHVPESVARAHIKDELLLADMAELALQSLYAAMLKESGIDAIGHPHLSITTIARDNALGFTIRTAVLPEITLPDYKTLAAAVPLELPGDLKEEDVEKVVQDLRQLRAYGHVHSEHDEHQHPEPLPEVTDEFAASFGGFKTVAELREKIRENLSKERVQQAKDKRRITILESILKETAFDIPAVILISEQEKMLAQIEADVSRAGLSMEDYFKQVQKTKEEVMEDFKPEAEKRSRMQLLLNVIAKDAKIAATDEEVNAEAERFVATYPGADKARAIAYADMLITNDKVLTMLEEQK